MKFFLFLILQNYYFEELIDEEIENPFLMDKSILHQKDQINDQIDKFVFMSNKDLKNDPEIFYQMQKFNQNKLDQQLLDLAYKRFQSQEKENQIFEKNLEKQKKQQENKIQFAQLREKKLKERNFQKIAEKIDEMESYVYKNFLKDYELALEKEDQLFEKINAQKKQLAEIAGNDAKEFTELVIGILMNAELKEKQYAIKDEDRPQMNLQKRKFQKEQTFKWINQMSQIPEFGKQNSQNLISWFKRHERLFGTEFEERYDPYTIFLKIVNLPKMFNLINNGCIEYISMDPESGGNSGDIFFSGGEKYTGEIYQNLPYGNGSLKMCDNSEFIGNFDGTQLVEGQFFHFQGLEFKGKFNKDRFYKGIINFTDGDSLKGEWGLKKGKWCLKKGVLSDEEKNLLYQFDKDNIKFQSKQKYIFACDSDKGFLIEFEHFFTNEILIQPLLITGDGSSSFNILKDKQCIQSKQYNFGIFPYYKEENFQNKKLIVSKYYFSIEKQIKFIKQLNEENWYVEFKLLQGVEGIGKLDFSKNKVTFKGVLLIDSEEDSESPTIKFSKSILGKLQIQISDQIFPNFDEMYQYLENVYEEIEIEECVRERKSSKCNKPIMKEIISEIKKSEDCKVF